MTDMTAIRHMQALPKGCGTCEFVILFGPVCPVCLLVACDMYGSGATGFEPLDVSVPLCEIQQLQ